MFNLCVKCVLPVLKMKYFYILFVITTVLGDEDFIVYGGHARNLEANTTESNEQKANVSCIRDHLYDNTNIQQVVGKWKALELYMHVSKEGVNVYHTCPKVTIWVEDNFPTTTFGPSTEYQSYHVQHINAKFRQEYRHIRLLWDEAGNTIEYSLYFKNDTAGYWQVFNRQNGTLTVPPNNYQQFTGTVQVLKAANDHLVLSFCQEGINGKTPLLFSVLFSREPGIMEIWERDSVHSMLQNKKLSIASRRMVCGNSADRSIGTSIILLYSTFLLIPSLLNL